MEPLRFPEIDAESFDGKKVRGYVLGTVDFLGLTLSESASGHKRIKWAEFRRNKKCGGVKFEKLWSIYHGMSKLFPSIPVAISKYIYVASSEYSAQEMTTFVV